MGGAHRDGRDDPAPAAGAVGDRRTHPDRSGRDRMERAHVFRRAGAALRTGRRRPVDQALDTDLPGTLGRAVRRQRDDHRGGDPDRDPRRARRRAARRRCASRRDPGADPVDRCPHGDRRGVLRRVQRGALPVRHDRRGLGRLHGGGHERVVPPTPRRSAERCPAASWAAPWAAARCRLHRRRTNRTGRTCSASFIAC